MKKTDQVELGRSFQQQEKVKVKVHKNNFVPFFLRVYIWVKIIECKKCGYFRIGFIFQIRMLPLN